MRNAGRLLLISGLLVGSLGCAKSPPTLAGGKPIAYWLEALRSPQAHTRKTAVFKLGNVGPAHAAALPAVIEALRDRDAVVRSEAIVAVLKFGSVAREALPVLRDLALHDSNAQVRRYAAKAVAKLQSEQ